MNVDERYQKLHEKKPAKKKQSKIKRVNQSAQDAKIYYRNTMKSLDNESKSILEKFSKMYPSIKKRMLLSFCEKHTWIEKYISIDLKHVWNIKKDIIGNKTISHSSDESETEESSPEIVKKKSKERRGKVQENKKKNKQFQKNKRYQRKSHYEEEYSSRDYYRGDYYEVQKGRGRRANRGNRRKFHQRRDQQRKKQNGNWQKNGTSQWKKKGSEERKRQGDFKGKEKRGERKKSEEEGERGEKRVTVGKEKGKEDKQKREKSAKEEQEELLNFSNDFLKKENMESPKSIQIVETFGEEKKPNKEKDLKSQFAKEEKKEEMEESEENLSEDNEHLMDEMNDSFKLMISEKKELVGGQEHSSLSNQVKVGKKREEVAGIVKKLVGRAQEKYETKQRIVVDTLRKVADPERKEFPTEPQMGFQYYMKKEGEIQPPKEGMQGGDFGPRVIDDFFEKSLGSNINQQTLYAKGVKNVTSNFTINTGMLPTSRRKVEKMVPMEPHMIGSSPEIFENHSKFMEKISQMKAQKISERVLQMPQTESYQNRNQINSLSLNMGNFQGKGRGQPHPRMVSLVTEELENRHNEQGVQKPHSGVGRKRCELLQDDFQRQALHRVSQKWRLAGNHESNWEPTHSHRKEH